VALQPGALSAALWQGRFRPVRLAVESSDAGVDALGQTLDALAAQAPLAGAAMQVEVADSLVHFDVAFGDFGGLGPRQLSAMASASMGELLGDRVHDHTLRWQLQRGEQHLLVGAIPKLLIQALADAAATHDMALAGVVPDFSMQWNRQIRRAPPDNAVFAVVSDFNALIACIRRGVITAISNGPWKWPNAVPDLPSFDALDRHVDRLLAGLGIELDPPPSFLLVTASALQPGLSTRWTILPHERAAA
jgi:hypothetical protein